MFAAPALMLPACFLSVVQVRGTDIPKPVKTWTQCGINVKVLEVLRKHGFERPLSIQTQVCTIQAGGVACRCLQRPDTAKLYCIAVRPCM